MEPPLPRSPRLDYLQRLYGDLRFMASLAGLQAHHTHIKGSDRYHKLQDDGLVLSKAADVIVDRINQVSD